MPTLSNISPHNDNHPMPTHARTMRHHASENEVCIITSGIGNYPGPNENYRDSETMVHICTNHQVFETEG